MRRSHSERAGHSVIWAFAWVVLGALSLSAQAQSRVESEARALEERLHAPCCRGLLLDAHESEPAHALRREIRARLEHGESSAAIESALVRRYGESIVAVPIDGDPRSSLSLALAVILASTALLISLLALRWVRRARMAASSVQAAAEPGGHDELDARIDAELRRLDA